MMWLLWLLLFNCVVLYLGRQVRSPLALIPGPGLTKFTSLWLKYQELRGNRRMYIHGLHKIYGPVVRIGPHEVSFTSYASLKEIYLSGGSGYDKTELYDLFQQFGHKTMFSTLERTEHRKRKWCFADTYAMTNVLAGQRVALERIAKDFVSRCVTSGGSTVDVYALLHCYALDAVTHFMFSSKGTHSLKDVNDREMMKEMTYHNSLQKSLMLYYLPWISRYIPRFLSQRPAPLTSNYVLHVIECGEFDDFALAKVLLSERTALTSMEVAAECMDHLSAGIDTTGDALCFTMWELSQPENAAIQETLRDELSQFQRHKRLDALPYLDAVIKEVLRLHPPIPMSFPRYVPERGRTIDGHFLPARTIVSCQPYSVHRINEDIFPKPETFYPERWLNADSAIEGHRYLFAFGVGGRSCTGRNLAWLEMKVLLLEVYSQFSTSIAPDMQSCMKLDDQIISARPKDQKCQLVLEPLH